MQGFDKDSYDQERADENARLGYMRSQPFRREEEVRWPMFLDKVSPYSCDSLVLQDSDEEIMESVDLQELDQEYDYISWEGELNSIMYVPKNEEKKKEPALKKKFRRLMDLVNKDEYVIQEREELEKVAKELFEVQIQEVFFGKNVDDLSPALLEYSASIMDFHQASEARAQYFKYFIQGKVVPARVPQWVELYTAYVEGRELPFRVSEEALQAEKVRLRSARFSVDVTERAKRFLETITPPFSSLGFSDLDFHLFLMSDVDRGFCYVGKPSYRSCFLTDTTEVSLIAGKDFKIDQIMTNPFPEGKAFLRYRIIAVEVEGGSDTEAILCISSPGQQEKTSLEHHYKTIHIPRSEIFDKQAFGYSSACVGDKVSGVTLLSSLSLKLRVTITYEFQDMVDVSPVAFDLLPADVMSHFSHLHEWKSVSKGSRSLFFSRYQERKNFPLYAVHTPLRAAYETFFRGVGQDYYSFYLHYFTKKITSPSVTTWHKLYRFHFFRFQRWFSACQETRVLQEYDEVELPCSFYFPALNHEMPLVDG